MFLLITQRIPLSEWWENTQLCHIPQTKHTLQEIQFIKKNLVLCLYTEKLQLGIVIPSEMFLLNDVSPIHVSFTAFSELFEVSKITGISFLNLENVFFPFE